MVDNINDLTTSKPTCDSAKSPHFKKNKQKKLSTLADEPSSNHNEKISSSAYSYNNDIDFLNIFGVSLINDYFNDGSITSEHPIMVRLTPDHEIFTDPVTV